jgi:hypothetical protein
MLHNQIAFGALLKPQTDETEAKLSAMLASSYPDGMYLWQAMKEPDWPPFKTAVQKETQDHEMNGYWEIVCHSTIPKNVPVLLAVWTMKRKRCISIREVYKWKARLTIDGKKQKWPILQGDIFACGFMGNYTFLSYTVHHT